ncbi:MAG: sigma-70 family RNA polymerase sigma factor [Chryseobacterium sp.]
MKLSGRHINTEKGSYENLVHQYNHQAFSFISKKIQNEEDALDVLQNVFMHLWICKKSLDSTNTANIIFTTCKDKIAEYYRTSKKRPLRENISSDPADTSFDDLRSAENKDRLFTELEQSIVLIIPPLRRKIFKMHKLEGITQEKIALELKIPKSTVKYHILEAMSFLKNYHKTVN